ncbi:hypothetical protein F5X68DRAFT_253274 [Plectosphaerella plurivora]|uniref:Secreted protein n=1 Tax=Plectosphaerella plurivora TaxID=936078 RepID=A0A9P9AA89_9PEZI|nr:hypothetical protein F5X68DRAFT_253274 [Plectosphaerella plurivora]
MPSAISLLNTRTVVILAISILYGFAPGANCLPTTNDVSLLQHPNLVKMGIVPPNIHDHMAKNPSLTDAQREAAQKNVDKSRELGQQMFEQSVRSAVPLEVLQRLVDDKALASECSDDVKKEVDTLLQSKSRWPSKPEVKVSDGLKAVLDANPGLWEAGTSQSAGDAGAEGKK